MSSMVFIPTYLQMCWCKQHGRFVFPSGQKSYEFASKDEAYAELERLEGEGKVTKGEGQFLRDCIRDQTNMASREDGVGSEAKHVTEFKNWYRDEREKEAEQEERKCREFRRFDAPHPPYLM